MGPPLHSALFVNSNARTLLLKHKTLRQATCALGMDRFVKRTSSSQQPVASAKRRKSEQWGDKTDPSSICIWNCNGLSVRLGVSSEREEFVRFVRDHHPDVVCLSEVRCAARSEIPNAKKNDGTKRYRGEFKTSSSTDAKSDGAAVEALLNEPEFSSYEPYFSLADWKYAGTGVLINRRAVAKPRSIRFTLDLNAKADDHDPNGRVILVEFGTFTLLHTYTPNNGWETGHFRRRQEWDETIQTFMQSQCMQGRNIIWAGDLNIAPLDVDLSHPSYYKRQVMHVKGEPPIAPENVGQPGCTMAERQRFEQVLEVGDLVDFYRHLHPAPNADAPSKDDLMLPIFSWRGHRSGKYSGRGLRIDHFIGSRALLERVTTVEIMGQGSERMGFMGSDHCPVILRLQGPTD